MIPGPVELSQDVLEVFRERPVAHYGPQWRDLYLRTTGDVCRVLGTAGMSFLIPGSGSLGLEVMAVSLARARRCLVLHNGFFGDRLVSILEHYAARVDVLRFGLGACFDLQQVERALRGGDYDCLWLNHVETSTGMLNPLREIAAAAREVGVMVFVDAVSSAAVEELRMDEWGIDGVVSASQKGFESPPGLAILCCSPAALEKMRGTPPGGWYTDLRVWLEYHEKWNDWHPFPVTLPTNTVRALGKSLQLMLQAGLEERLAGFRAAADRLRRALRALGLELYVPDGRHAHGLTSVTTQGRFDPGELVAFLKERLQIQIAGSLGELKGSLFRIGHMSRSQIEPRNLTALLGGITLFLRSRGMEASSDAALRELAR